MKKFYQFFLAMLLIGFSTVGMKAQLTCKESLTVAVDMVDGTAEIIIDSIVTGNIPDGTEISQSTFTCEDVGKTVIVVATDGDSDCETGVQVVDVTPPVAIADLEVNFTLPEGEEFWLLNPHIIDDGSFDNCSEVSLSVMPEYITCEMIGDAVDVVMTVTDASGNSNQVQTTVNVTYEGDLEVECREDFEVSLISMYLVSVQNIQNGGIVCELSSVTLQDASGTVIPDNIIREVHIGETLIATLSSNLNDSSCTTSITVVDSPCEEFFVCDTKCNEEPLGDCDSGHTSADNIEWPCDLSLSGSFLGLVSINPDSLIANYGALVNNARPQVAGGECYEAAMTYVDELFAIEDQVKIVREWVVVEWNSGAVANYSQIISFESNGVDIVWNTEDFMWPEDASAKDHRISPDELEQVSGLLELESRPMFVANKDFYRTTYSDAVYSSSEEELIVERTWKVSAFGNPTLFATEQQLISVPVVEGVESKVYVTTFGGRPMPGVSVNNTVTNNDGIAEVSGTGSLDITYEDDPYEGIDILDLVLLREYILAKVDFPDTPYPGLDLTGNGTVSTLDLLQLQKIILRIAGEENRGWRFAERPEGIVQARGDFISYKLGDIDDSALLQESVDESEIVNVEIDDLLLNDGEEYEVDFVLDLNTEILAAQIELQIDLDLVEVSAVKTMFNEEEQTWHVREDGSVLVVFTSQEPVEIDSESVLFSVKFKAKGNSTLAEAISYSPSRRSFLVSSELERIFIGLDVQNTITSGVHTPRIVKNVIVTPNPATHFIEVPANDFILDVYDAHGTKVLRTRASKIDVSHLPTGIYVVNGRNDKEVFSSRFIKM